MAEPADAQRKPSSRSPMQFFNSRSQSPAASRSQGHPSRPGNTVASLKDRSVRDLETLLKSKEAYNAFLQSLDPVKHLKSLVQDLRKSNVEVAKKNLAKEADISELNNQCAIIRTTELAAAREKFKEDQAREREVFNRLSHPALCEKLQQAATKADEESENLHRRFVRGEIELGEFISTYRKQRLLYHNRSLTRLAVAPTIALQGL